MKINSCLPVLAMLAIGSLYISSCQKKEESAKNEMQKYVTISDSADANAKLLMDYQTALTEGNYAKVRTLLEPSFKSYGPSASDSVNVDSLIKRWEGTHSAYSGLKIVDANPLAFTSSNSKTKGDWVAIWGRYSATYKATGKTVNFPFHLIGKVENGKLRLTGDYWDKAQFIGPMGNKLVKAN
ncbi:nuclear transport factor 2 family protein [Spirosoma gilvum]